MNLRIRSESIGIADGQEVPVERGALRVPAVWGQSDPGHFELAFVRTRGSANDRGHAIFLLPGGPGFGQLQHISSVLGKPLRPSPELGDFIVVEQRCVGHSRPRLDCPGTYSLPFDQPLHMEAMRAAHRRYIRRAVSFWKDQGVNLAGLNVRNMAADVDALRSALGYDQVSLIGGSFGSHHALAVMRDFGTHIRRVVLSGVEGPNHTMKLPSSVQQTLESLDHLLAQNGRWSKEIDKLTDLMADILNRLDRLNASVETTHPKTRRRVPITLGKLDLQWIIADRLGSTKFLKALPRRLSQLKQGDFEWLAEKAARMRSERSSNLVYEAVDCASGATSNRKAQIRAEAPGTLLEDVINETVFDVCDLFGQEHDLGDEFRGPVHSDIPVLLTAGSLDARTPVSNAEEVLRGLPNGHLLVVAGASHDHMTHGAHPSELARTLHSFLLRNEIPTGRITTKFEFDPPP